MSEDEKGYNGWKNYETWVTKLWLDNDQDTYDHCRELMEEAKKSAEECSQVKEEIWTIEEAKRFLLADYVKNVVVDMLPTDKSSLSTDLLNSAVEDIDFQEIADNLLSE